MKEPFSPLDREKGHIVVSACGRKWTLSRPADLESLWNAVTEEICGEDERLPYWVELWPASLTLASWLQANRMRIKDRYCLDLGCGLGFTALVAQSLGAKVLGVDYEPAALVYARANAVSNGTPAPLLVVMDWRFPAVLPASCEYIWAGDIVYEHRFIRPLLDFFRHALAREGIIWIAEPDRTVYTLFRQALEGEGLFSRRVVRERVPDLHSRETLVTVNLWEIGKKLGQRGG
ncbi:MAG: 50S ribosomal protein L11 methyltransferase [Desulfovibrio sp.]|jgi:predicted nicotinamide N-methyase|nr:50S ribosomal protein L11 methyltransferase [Desulfovibrio sp.]